MTRPLRGPLQEDEIKNDFFLPKERFLPSLVASRTGHGEIIAQEDRE